MADRSSAGLFATLFDALAKGEPLNPDSLWEMTESYDFDPYQMYCDDALTKLGLMRRCTNKECPDREPEYGGVHVYGPEDTECYSCGEIPTD